MNSRADTGRGFSPGCADRAMVAIAVLCILVALPSGVYALQTGIAIAEAARESDTVTIRLTRPDAETIHALLDTEMMADALSADAPHGTARRDSAWAQAERIHDAFQTALTER